MKKLYVSRILKFTALLLTLVTLLLLAQEYLFFYTDYNQERFEKFYNEEPNSLDMVVLGVSESHTGYSPGYAYDRFGFTSYLYTQDSNHGQLYEAQLKEILAHQSPELIVVETFGFFYTGDVEEPRFRIFVENIPFSFNRVKTVMESPFDQKLSYLFPMIKYHGKWWSHDMLKNNIKFQRTDRYVKSNFKGMMTHTTIFDPATLTEPALPFGELHVTEVSASLVDFLEFCREEGLDNIIFVNFPRHEAATDLADIQNRVYTIEGIVTSYGYPFVDFQKHIEDIGIDFATDYYDEHHMNTYGQFKMTEYFGNMLVNEYGLTPQEQTEENRAHWEQCAEYVHKYYALADDYIQRGEEITLCTENSYLEALQKWEKAKQ